MADRRRTARARRVADLAGCRRRSGNSPTGLRPGLLVVVGFTWLGETGERTVERRWRRRGPRPCWIVILLTCRLRRVAANNRHGQSGRDSCFLGQAEQRGQGCRLKHAVAASCSRRRLLARKGSICGRRRDSARRLSRWKWKVKDAHVVRRTRHVRPRKPFCLLCLS